MKLSASRRLWIVLGVTIIVFAAAVFGSTKSRTVRDWLWLVTGEEDYWEGVKGSVALALLEASSQELNLAPDEPMDHVGLNPYGVNVFLQLEADPENVRRSLSAVKDAGIGWARQEFPWEDIEIHGRGDFEDRRNEPPRSAWDKYDLIVKTAEDHNVELLVRLDNPPDWAFADPAASGEKGPPDDLADFGNYVAAVAERYCGRVKYYQIWNEPNIYPEWGERDVDPAGYAELLRIAADRARAACDDVVIVSAALAQTTETSGRNMDDLVYLEALYEAGWQPDFDILAAQAFGLWTGPTDHRVSRDRTNFVRHLLVRDLMVRHSDAHKPIWLTEMGWDSPPEDMAAPYGRISEEGRARYTVEAYRRMTEEWPWIGVAYLWFLRRPDWQWHERPEGYFRLLEPDWQRTPTYDAIQQAALGTNPVVNRGYHKPSDWAVTYTGPWRDKLSGAEATYKAGARDAELHFVFLGTGFEIDVAESDDEFEVFLVVDSKGETVSHDQASEGALSRSDLEYEEHIVMLRVDSGAFSVSGIRVYAPDPVSPARRVLRLVPVAFVLTIGAGVLGLWWVWRGRAGRSTSLSGSEPAS